MPAECLKGAGPPPDQRPAVSNRCRIASDGHPDGVDEDSAGSDGATSRVRGWAKRHPSLAALLALVVIFVVLYAAFVLKFVWDMQHSSL